MLPLSPFLASLDRILREQNRRAADVVHGASRLQTCSDCRRPGSEGYHSLPTVNRVLCDPCYRWRAARGIDGPFDPRSRSQMEAAERQGAA